MTDTLQAYALVAQWRREADIMDVDIAAQPFGNRVGFQVEQSMYRKCADELEAALSAVPVGPNPEPPCLTDLCTLACVPAKHYAPCPSAAPVSAVPAESFHTCGFDDDICGGCERDERLGAAPVPAVGNCPSCDSYHGLNESCDPVPDYKALYHELLFAVAKKFPGETRHQTALRYIQQAERPSSEKSAAYKNPNCTIDHPGQSCNVACGYD